MARATIILASLLGALAVVACGKSDPPPPLPSASVAAAPGVEPVDGPTLKAVRARGRLNCGVAADLPGFASRDVLGQWRGFDVDFCRAVAAAVFGDARQVRLVPLASKAQFTALQSDQVDLLARGGISFSRDTGLGLDFVGASFFDGQGFLVGKALAGKTSADLASQRICVQAGTPAELNLAEFYRDARIKPRKVVADSEEEILAAYLAGDCDALTGDRSSLAAVLSTMRNADSRALLAEEINKEPKGPVVRQGDSQWADIVRWTLNAMILGEELSITTKTVSENRDKPASPEIGRLLAGDGFGANLLLRDDWAYQIIRQVGNYGEVFARNLGPTTALKLERGRNAQWNAEMPGLLYAPPMR